MLASKRQWKMKNIAYLQTSKVS